MTDTNVIKLAQPGTFSDSLTEILRNGARALLAQAFGQVARDPDGGLAARLRDHDHDARRASRRGGCGPACQAERGGGASHADVDRGQSSRRCASGHAGLLAAAARHHPLRARLTNRRSTPRLPDSPLVEEARRFRLIRQG